MIGIDGNYMLCKLLGHKFIQPHDVIFCQRCGFTKDEVIALSKPISKGFAYIAGSEHDGERMEEDKIYKIK